MLSADVDHDSFVGRVATAMENGADRRRPRYGNSLSGQFGHVIVSETGRGCNCGRIGCVETFSSGTAFARLLCAAELPEGTQVQTVLDRAAKGDSTCMGLLTSWARPLRRAIQSLIAVLNPKLILLAGDLAPEMTIALQNLPVTDRWFSLPIEASHTMR